MTTLIQQKSGNDCVLAAIAMARGCESWDDIWTQDDLDKVIASKGVAHWEDWMKRAGFVEDVHYRDVYCNGGDAERLKALLWRRRALLSVGSLNNAGGSHAVYWDGAKLWDPHEGHYPQYLAYRHLSSVCLSRALIFSDTPAYCIALPPTAPTP